MEMKLSWSLATLLIKSWDGSSKFYTLPPADECLYMLPWGDIGGRRCTCLHWDPGTNFKRMTGWIKRMRLHIRVTCGAYQHEFLPSLSHTSTIWVYKSWSGAWESLIFSSPSGELYRSLLALFNKTATQFPGYPQHSYCFLLKTKETQTRLLPKSGNNFMHYLLYLFLGCPIQG